MPPPDAGRPGRGYPAEWLRYAHSDLAVAAVDPGPRVLLETLCYHAQQAAEKALKAVLIAGGGDPPYTHDLSRLFALVSQTHAVPEAVAAASELTRYAIEARYPDDLGEVEEAEWRTALEHARAAVEWAERVVAGSAP